MLTLSWQQAVNYSLGKEKLDKKANFFFQN